MSSPSVITNFDKPMCFKLTLLNPSEILSQISKLTNNFNPEFNLSEEYVKNLKENLTNENQNSLFRGFLNTPKDDDGSIMKQVIGRNGCYFHMTTQNTKSLFIWHDRDNHKIYVWGEKFPTINSLKIIHQRIKKYSSNK